MNPYTFDLLSNTESISAMREGYLDALPYAQEYYLEILKKSAQIFQINRQSTPAGYFYLSSDGRLLEYYLASEWVNETDSLFGTILDKFRVKKALCKSFDECLLSCCYGFHKDSKSIGILFREYQKKSPVHPPDALSIRRANIADETAIIAVNEEVFDHPSEVAQYIAANQIFLFEKKNDLVGFGIYTRTIPDRPEHDVGMLVLPAYRKKGYGQFIIQYLVDYCFQNAWKPTSGCAIENIASRKCLEKSGFITRHRLLEFTFNYH